MMDNRKRDLEYAWAFFGIFCLLALLNFRAHWQEQSLKAHDRVIIGVTDILENQGQSMDHVITFAQYTSKRLGYLEEAVEGLDWRLSGEVDDE